MKHRLHQTLLAGIVSGSFIMSAYAGNVSFTQIPFEILGGGEKWLQVSDNGEVAFSVDSKGYIWSIDTGARLLEDNLIGYFLNISNDGRTARFGNSVFKDDTFLMDAPAGHGITTISPDGSYLGINYSGTPKILNIDTGSVQTFNNPQLERYFINDFSNDGSTKLLSCTNMYMGCLGLPFYLADENNNIHEVQTSYSTVSDLSGDGSAVIGKTSFCDSGASYCNVVTRNSEAVEIESILVGNSTVTYRALNYDGSIAVGEYRDYGNNNWGGRLWDIENGERDIVDVLAQNGIDISGWDQLRLANISDNGNYIVGHGINPQGNRRGFIISSVPECSAGGLF